MTIEFFRWNCSQYEKFLILLQWIVYEGEYLSKPAQSIVTEPDALKIDYERHFATKCQV